jgi:hypothetical protein
MIEHPLENSTYTYSLACGSLKKHRYINPKLERELVDFKLEVEAKHKLSSIKDYLFPRRRGNITVSSRKRRVITNKIAESMRESAPGINIREMIKNFKQGQLRNSNHGGAVGGSGNRSYIRYINQSSLD